MGNILVGQSGGPTAAINASLYGIIAQGKENMDIFEKIYGMRNGIEGFLDDRYVNLSDTINADDLELLKTTPSAYLGSCRYKLPKDINDAVYPRLFEKLNALNITALFYIGGNDSMDTVAKLSAYAQTIGSDICILGIPKTIDNDLVEIDHTPGFGSAAKFVASAVRDISMDSHVYNTKSVTIIEIMGRHAGWLTAASLLARKDKQDNPTLIYLPEVPFKLESFYRDVEEKLAERNNVTVCVSEGISDEHGVFLCEYLQAAEADTFGHKNLTGCGKLLENMVKSKFGVKVRSVELNVIQRACAFIGSKADIEEAVAASRFGVQAALAGETGKMISCERDASAETYTLRYKTVPVSLVCNREKKFPLEWITKNGTDISPAFLEYCTPLIMGEMQLKTENGLPAYCYLK
ncbi:MAG: 6-phosphofructokinase [Oscillospiraceae bacterium]|nr:6-phosphofructokinase [Oscillospiraceae bacterium]